MRARDAVRRRRPAHQTDTTGELRGVRGLYVGDASVFPTAPGVNPMITIMGMARRSTDFVVNALRQGR
jgi:choline dehydrogenase-like flavoprotein